MSLLNRFVWIFVSPSRVFADIREGKVAWWQPWVGQSVAYVIAGWIAIPVQRAVMELNLNNLPAEQFDKQVAYFEKFEWLQVLLTPPMLLVVGLALAGLTYVLVTILSPKASFKQYFTLTLFASIIGAVSLIVSNVVVRLRGVDTIRAAADAQFSLGLGFLAPEGVPHAVLNSIDVFSLWSLVLIAMGLAQVFAMSRKQAVLCVIPWWVIYVLFSIIGEAFGGMR